MSEETLASFTVKRLRVLDENGEVDASLLPPLTEEQMLRMYELMLLTRGFDERALALQREGRLGTYPPSLGQEASQVGSAFALEPTDWVFPSFREAGVHLSLGFPMWQLFQYWSGDERGQVAPEGINIFPFCVTVASQLPHAVGAALAARYRGDATVTTAYFGDGATSKGDFHEAFNMAGLFKLPVVFICQNNQWAISVPVQGQTAAATLAQKAFGYGFEGIQVDGNDVFAVYRAVKGAVDRARSGGGPTFVECLTYRVADHTTADDASRYRAPEEVLLWRGRDPILRLERYLMAQGILNDDRAKEVRRRVSETVDRSVQAMETITPPTVAEMFQNTAATLSRRQAAQLEDM